MLVISKSLKHESPGGFIGAILFKNVTSPGLSPRLEQEKEALENQLRTKSSMALIIERK